jgi:hypothetical protein
VADPWVAAFQAADWMRRRIRAAALTYLFGVFLLGSTAIPMLGLLWVKLRRTQCEQMFSGTLKADIAQYSRHVS